LNFTGQYEDTLSGLYDFLYREYSPVQGRWISPDPAGLAAVDPTNPQSWNRYAYALNSPVRYIDPTGLECVWDDGSFDSEDDAQTGSVGGCQGLAEQRQAFRARRTHHSRQVEGAAEVGHEADFGRE